MSEWQPIETAPKTGAWFVTFTPDPKFNFDFAVFEDGEFCKVRCGYQFATHWMPLPEAPENGG